MRVHEFGPETSGPGRERVHRSSANTYAWENSGSYVHGEIGEVSIVPLWHVPVRDPVQTIDQASLLGPYGLNERRSKLVRGGVSARELRDST